MKNNDPLLCDTPNAFVSLHASDVIGELHGFDRVRLQGTLPSLYHPKVMQEHLWREEVLLKDYAAYAQAFTKEMRAEIEAAALRRQRQVVYLRSAKGSKEEEARAIAEREGIDSGVICVFSALETAPAWEVHGNRATRRLELQLRPRRAIHLYVYLLHAVLGFMHVRFQTYFPFLVQICLNGREWLARQMTQAGLGFVRERNCFSRLDDPAAAQRLMDAQLATNWPQLCHALVEEFNPVAARVRAPLGLEYYWTTPETEYASDVMFTDRARLAAFYPKLIHHGITSFGCEQVLRFAGRSSRGFKGELKTRRAAREEGVCLKHWVKANSIKMYDKGSVLRVETTINQPHDFRVLRQVTPEAEPTWQPLRRSTADLHRRAEVSRAATLRYFEALSAVEDTQALAEAAVKICHRVHWHGQTHRALNPFAELDAALLTAINDGKYTISGFTNADLRTALKLPRRTALQRRRASAQVTRRIRLLRAHHLLKKVPRSHRYHVTPKGRRLITALLSARRANVDALTKLAA